jgi:hypothetical protein
MFSIFGFAFLSLVGTRTMAQELAPTELTSFQFPNNGSGIDLPFPDAIAKLTGLSAWPAPWVTPPFTANMAKLFNPLATTTLADIVAPPSQDGFPVFGDFC